MQITIFSFLMSVIWSSVIILLIHIFRKKQFFLNGFGLMTVILFYAFSIGRMLFAIEFPFTREVPVPKLYNSFYNAIQMSHFSLGERDISFISLFLFLWCAVSVILLAVFFARNLMTKNNLRAYRFVSNERLQCVLEDMRNTFGDRLNIRIFECPDISIPMGAGILNKYILIPQAEYSDDALRHIILHEYMHFRNKDLQILLLTELFARVFWWNPLVYLFKSDIRQILEIRCDLSVITGMSEEQRVHYLRTIRNCLVQSNKLKTAYAPIASAQLIRKDLKTEEMMERFKLIAYPIKKNYFWFQSLSVICFALLLMLSYSFIFQPQYQPPKEDVFTDSNVGVSGTLSGYILVKKDGTYIFVDETGFEFEIKKETVDQFISDGFEVRKE